MTNLSDTQITSLIRLSHAIIDWLDLKLSIRKGTGVKALPRNNYRAFAGGTIGPSRQLGPSRLN